VVAYAVGRMAGDVFFTFWNATLFAGLWMLFGHAGGCNLLYVGQLDSSVTNRSP
jgi:hypothetical protein